MNSAVTHSALSDSNSSKRRWIELAAFGVVLGMILAGSALGYRHFSIKRIREDLRVYLEQSMNYHAAELAERHREHLTRDAEGCRLSLVAFSRLKQVENLGWTTESCDMIGFEGNELVIAKAVLKDTLGLPNEALRILKEASDRKPGDPIPYIKMAEIYSQNDKPEIARDAWLAAVAQAPQDTQISLLALRYLHQQSFWSEARKLATGLLPRISPEDIETQALLASTLEKGGDTVGAFQIKKKIQERVGSNQELLSRLSKAYPELFDSSKAKTRKH